MIINISDVWQDAETLHTTFLEKVLDDGLIELSNSVNDKNIHKFVKKNRDIILNGSPRDLVKSISQFDKIFKEDNRNRAIEKLKIIFNFSEFSKKSDEPWTAYKLCKKARYQACCYCHLITIGTSLPNQDTKGYRPPLDHYFSKSEYPFLALTLSNLIPCCEKCNGSQMKGAIDFYKRPHLNPLIDDESIEFLLAANTQAQQHLAESTTLNLPKDNYCLKLVVTDNPDPSNASINTFQLNSRYQEHSDRAFYLARKIRGAASRIQMQHVSLDFNTTIEDYLEFHPKNYKDVPHGKMRLCIAKQFGALID